MTPRQQRAYELARIAKSIAFFQDLVKQRIRLIPQLPPADAWITRFEISNDKFIIKRFKAEYKELLNKPLGV